MKKANRILCYMAAVVLLLQLTACGADAKRATIDFAEYPEYTCIKNSEGQQVTFNEYWTDLDDELFFGDLKLYSYDLYENGEIDEYRVVVDDSDRFEFTPARGSTFMDRDPDDPFYDLFFTLKNQHNKMIKVEVDLATKVVIDKRKVTIYCEKGSTMDYHITGYVPSTEDYFFIDGVTTKDIVYEPTQDGIVLSGAMGKTKIDVDNKALKDDLVQGTFFFYGGTSVIKRNGKSISVTNAVRLNTKKTKKVTNLYLRPSNGGKNMFLTWNKVKKAKSYIVYRYDYNSKKYKRVAVRNGQGANYYNIPKADANQKYKYKVEAKTKKGGKGKKVCKRSYAVKAVAQSNSKGNAGKITTSKTAIAKKAGKTAKLKAKVETTDKQLLSTNIRWYSSNKKIAGINKKTGKVKFNKKGTCYVWAKAHNGLNSKKVKVTVK